MKQFMFVLGAIILFSGCAEKVNRAYIDNYGLCSSPANVLYLSDISVENNSDTLNVTPHEIKMSLATALKETNCFKIVTVDKGDEPSELEDGYVVNVKVVSSREKEVMKENLLSKEEKERIAMVITLSAHNVNRKVFVSAKGELITDKSKYFGIEKETSPENDKRSVMRDATKKAAISLQREIINQ